MGNIKNIRIQNFKSLKDITIDFKPLTFLFGPNSSGKSSVLQALMFLEKNISLSAKSNAIFNISKNINLYSYKQTVFNSNIKNDIIFSIHINGDIDFLNQEFLFKIFPNNKLRESFFREINVPQNINNLFSFFSYLYDHLGMLQTDNSIDNFDYSILFEKYKYDVEIIIKFSFNNGKGYLKYISFTDYISNTTLILENNKNKNDETIIKLYPQIKTFKLFHKFSIRDFIDAHKEIYSHKLLYKNNKISGLERLYNPFEFNNDTIWIEPFFDIVESYKKNEIILKSKLHDNFIKCLYIYLYYDIIPNDINKVLSNYFHAPTIREIPKPKYVLEENGNFTEGEYYNYLNFIEIEQNKFKNIIFKKSKDIPSSNFFNKVFSIVNINKKSVYFDIFSNLKMLGYEKLIFIDKSHNKELGYIYTISKNGNKILMCNESSGFIQIIPIVISLQKMQQIDEYFKINNTYKRFTDIYTTSFEIRKNTNYSLLFFEQPELHLHPKIQSKLAELLLKFIKRKKYITIVTETHSEHLIRKLQVLVAQSTINKEDIGVNYFYMENGITQIKKMEMDEKGLFKEDWPEGFFDESIDLTLEHYRALKNKKI